MKTLHIISIFFIGSASGYALNEALRQTTTHPHQDDDLSLHRIEQLENRLNVALELLDAQTPAAAEPSAPNSKMDNASTQSNTTTPKPNNTPTAITGLFAQAQQAVANHDQTLAMQLYNKLLLIADNDAAREQAREGLFDVMQLNFEYLRSLPGQTNAALWTLYEMNKLKPSNQIQLEIQQLSQQAYAEAQLYLNQNDPLQAGDHLNSLMHLTNMLDYQIAADNGDPLPSNGIREQLQTIENQPGYLTALQQRAEQRLYSGTALEQAFVFWDYTRLTRLDNALLAGDNLAFQEQFVQATVAHLNHLQTMNQAGELRARLDFIGYVYPQIMQDNRVANFY